MKYYEYQRSFVLESGEQLPGIKIAYSTYGVLNEAGDNVVWICHALTANSEVAEWWGGVVGTGQVISPEKYFIVCANIIGSCYGSSGPLALNPLTAKPYFETFPSVTVRDMVKAHILLREHLCINRIHLLMGGSMGGYQVLEWAVMEKERIKNLFLLATSAAESAWGIATHTAQRLAIEADATWRDASPDAGANGLKAARGIGMLTYRNYGIMVKNQTDPDPEKLDDYRASSYINYQGDKLVRRFNAYTYWLLTKAMDSHHLARGRGGQLEKILGSIHQPTLIVGISSDILCPVQEQQFLADKMPAARFVEIDSAYGHDGFMVESVGISEVLGQWLSS